MTTVIDSGNAVTQDTWIGTQKQLERFAELVRADERGRWEAIVCDGFRVLNELDAKARGRTSHENVSDVLDALMRVIRAEARESR